MNKVLLLIAGLLMVLTSTGQVSVIESTPLPRDTTDRGRAKEIPDNLPRKKWDYGVQLGTSASFSKGYGSGISTFVSPHVSWQPTSRFRLNAGIRIVNTTLFGYKPYLYGIETGSGWSGNYTHALLYVEGAYLLSRNLLLNGALYAEVPITGSDPSNPLTKSNFKGFSMDLQYRIGPNATIQAGFNYFKAEGPFYQDPFRSYGSAYSDPFSTGYTRPFNW